jgi:hypothetical protein
VSLLFLMCYLDYAHASVALVAPIFIARTALMNCTKALTRSVIMDAVPKVRPTFSGFAPSCPNRINIHLNDSYLINTITNPSTGGAGQVE